MAPRIHLGEVSDWYSGTAGQLRLYRVDDLLNALIKPTPYPAKNRPATKRGIAVAAVYQSASSNTCGNTHLEGYSQTKDSTRQDQAHPPTKIITHWSRRQSAKKGSCRQDRDDFRMLARSDVWLSFFVSMTGREFVFPVIHGQDASNGAGIVAKEDTAKGDECANDNGRHGRALVRGPVEERHVFQRYSVSSQISKK